MILIAASILAMLASYLFYWWREAEIREFRWRLDALRDSLRRRACEDIAFRNSTAFMMMDRTLTTFSQRMDRMTIWHFAPLFFGTELSVDQPPAGGRKPVDDLPRWMADPFLMRLTVESGKTVFKYFAIRHVFLFILVGISGLGTVFLFRTWKGIGGMVESIVLGAPDTRRKMRHRAA